MGEPERASRVYREENVRRASVLESMRHFIGPLTPFLEIGANVGHSSLMLMEKFGAEGFALDLSADSLQHGYTLMADWGVARGPVRIAGDALRLPFPDGSLRAVLAFQMLSQFMDIEAVFQEVKRVLQPGGFFIFAEEPLRRLATLRLWRTPYYEQMQPWERLLYDWGLLPFLVSDVIGAGQEERFGIRQNHRMTLVDWHALTQKHFVAHEYRVFVPQRGPFEKLARKIAIRLDPYRSEWRAARLLGGTLAAACQKEGTAREPAPFPAQFESLLACPDCGGVFRRETSGRLECQHCGYTAEADQGVYNLLPSRDRRELYPGDRPETVDMSRPGHESRLGPGWYDVEGVPGNRYRWMGPEATLRLSTDRRGVQRLRLRGYRLERLDPPRIALAINGRPAGSWRIDRPGLFVIEAEVESEPAMEIRIEAQPTFLIPPDERVFSVNFSLIQLLPRREEPAPAP